MVNFMVEISEEAAAVVYPTPAMFYTKKGTMQGATLEEVQEGRIYYLDIRRHPRSSWWTDWGGWYDTFVGSDIAVRYGDVYLRRMDTFDDMMAYGFSLFVVDGIAYFNIPTKHPWFYPEYFTDFRRVLHIVSTVLDPGNPSNNLINNANALTRLEPPNANMKLSNNHNGVALRQDFNVGLINNDGYFDDCDEWNMFNTPVRLLKTTKRKPEYADFRSIRDGYIETTKTDMGGFSITVADRFRMLNEPACDVVERGMFGIYDIDEIALGKNVPRVYGRARVRLLRLTGSVFLVGHGARGTARVLDRDGNFLVSAGVDNGVVNVGFAHRDRAAWAVVDGVPENRLGEIIKDLMFERSGIPFLETFWNLEETADYVERLSPRINAVISRGGVAQAIGDLLGSQMAFLIQQTDGRFTIRQFGESYATHEIPAAMLTKKPVKDYARATENYFSSCVINYWTDENMDGGVYSSLLYDEREERANARYKKRVRKEFNTDLTNEADALAFARLLSDRYTTLRQNVRVAVGVDTSHMNLLDTVVMEIGVNGRKLSNATKFVITELDPAQDTLVLEEI